MSSLNKIDVLLVNSTASPESQNTTPSQPGDYTINIQATDGWIVTGKYRHNLLQAITINKLTPKESRE